MFTALITYNCSLINLPELSSYNDTLNNCSVTGSSTVAENDTVNVTCDNIENSAGRNLVFILSGNHSSQIINNETFTITLNPLPLNDISINITENKNFTATVVVPDCEKIVDPKYLVFRCNVSDASDKTFSPECTLICSDLEPGSIYYASLVRLRVPIADKNDGNDTTFPEDYRNKTYRTGYNKCVCMIIIEVCVFLLF
jgi:hypothetical protein